MFLANCKYFIQQEDGTDQFFETLRGDETQFTHEEKITDKVKLRILSILSYFSRNITDFIRKQFLLILSHVIQRRSLNH